LPTCSRQTTTSWPAAIGVLLVWLAWLAWRTFIGEFEKDRLEVVTDYFARPLKNPYEWPSARYDAAPADGDPVTIPNAYPMWCSQEIRAAVHKTAIHGGFRKTVWITVGQTLEKSLGIILGASDKSEARVLAADRLAARYEHIVNLRDLLARHLRRNSDVHIVRIVIMSVGRVRARRSSPRGASRKQPGREEDAESGHEAGNRDHWVTPSAIPFRNVALSNGEPSNFSARSTGRRRCGIVALDMMARSAR
jgi:hypothetical protein